MGAATDDPLLWHLPISHYSEKVRWTLDYKAVPHRRRPVTPPAHMPVAYAITRGRGYTFPLLQIDGRVLGDSTEIIATLEKRHPERPLYPSDPEALQRALELEEYFDETTASAARLLAFHEMRSIWTPWPRPSRGCRRRRREARARRDGRGAVREGVRRAPLRSDSDEAADAARAALIESPDRIEAELDAGGGDYLVGDEFTVADHGCGGALALAVQPPEVRAPRSRLRHTSASRRRCASVAPSEWVKQTFARHRSRPD